MEENNKIFDQFKKLAESDEDINFSSMEKVWNKVEDKLDQKVLKKETKTWKKIAVAATILLGISIVYQFLKEDKIILKNNNTIVTTSDSINIKNEDVVVSTEELNNPAIVPQPEKVLQDQLNQNNSAETDTVKTTTETVAVNDDIETNDKISTDGNASFAPSKTNSSWPSNPNFNARGVVHGEPVAVSSENNEKTEKEKKSKVKSSSKKIDPVVFLNGQKSNEYEVSNLDEDEIESLVELPNPLYIINGTYITEEELFGPNPTSLYAPLHNQKIETISILQDEKAISIYGEKGKNGVVIITTKDGKPTPKKR